MWVGTRTSIQKMPNQSECFRWWFVKTLNFEPWIHLSRKFNFLGRISCIQIRLRLKIMVEASSCFNLISTKKGERVTRKQEFASLTNFLLNFKWSLKFFQTASLTCVILGLGILIQKLTMFVKSLRLLERFQCLNCLNYNESDPNSPDKDPLVSPIECGRGEEAFALTANQLLTRADKQTLFMNQVLMIFFLIKTEWIDW